MNIYLHIHTGTLNSSVGMLDKSQWSLSLSGLELGQGIWEYKAQSKQILNPNPWCLAVDACSSPTRQGRHQPRATIAKRTWPLSAINAVATSAPGHSIVIGVWLCLLEQLFWIPEEHVILPLERRLTAIANSYNIIVFICHTSWGYGTARTLCAVASGAMAT